MTIVNDYDHAPSFDVRYTVPAHKLPNDQASELRRRCATRHAGRFVAWTEEEAIRAAIDSGSIPSGALDVKATRLEQPGEEQIPLFGGQRRD